MLPRNVKSCLRYGVWALLFCWAFFIYGGTRTLGDVGFNWALSLKAMLTAGFGAFPIYFLALAACAKSASTKPLAFTGFTCLIVLGAAVVSELSLLADERAFVIEAQNSHQLLLYRARSWPFGDSDLVYDHGSFHSPD